MLFSYMIHLFPSCKLAPFSFDVDHTDIQFSYITVKGNGYITL